MSNLRFREQGTTPADAAAGQVQMYAKTDGKLYTKRGGDAEKSISDSASTVGKLLQVAQYFNDNDTAAFSGTGLSSWTKCHYLSAQFVNPLTAGSKILLSYRSLAGVSGYSVGWAKPIYVTAYNGGTNIGNSTYGFAQTNVGEAPMATYGTYSDPGGAQYIIAQITGEILFTPTDTYGNCQIYWVADSTHTSYLGRSGSNYGGTQHVLTIMEIAG